MKILMLFLFLFSLTSCKSKNSDNKYAEGEKNYRVHCSACHQLDGSGIEKLYPPLIKNETINGEKDELIGIILNGLSGPIKVNGIEYNQVMISHNFLNDQEIADLLSWLRQSFENSANAVSESEVSTVRKKIQ
jgi:mono/diheme cytochrome c family protein